MLQVVFYICHTVKLAKLTNKSFQNTPCQILVLSFSQKELELIETVLWKTHFNILKTRLF